MQALSGRSERVSVKESGSDMKGAGEPSDQQLVVFSAALIFVFFTRLFTELSKRPRGILGLRCRQTALSTCIICSSVVLVSLQLQQTMKQH